MRIRIGLLGIHSENYYAEKYKILQRCEDGLKELCAQEDGEVITYPLIESEDQAKAAKRYFEQKKIDYLLILNADFSPGDMILPFEDIRVPIGVWAVPEPASVGDIQLNSTVSANLYISIGARKFKQKRQFKWFYGMPEDPCFKERFFVTVGGLKGKKALREGTIGVLGGVAPTFYNLENDGVQLQEKYGMKIKYFSIEDLKRYMGEITKAEQIIWKKIIRESGNCTNSISDEALVQGARIYLGLKKLVKEHHISALASSCWPEFQEEFSSVPCVPFTLLGEYEGVPVACEGDIGGAVSLLLAKEIGRNVPTLMDLTMLNFQENELLLWHCGIGSCSLAPKKDKKKIIPHPMLDRKNPNREFMGLAYDYYFEKGPVTILRYSNNGEIICFCGEVRESEEGFAGTRGYIHHFTCDGEEKHVKDIINGIFQHGIEHHMIINRGHFEEELREFAHLTGTKLVEIGTYKNYQ